MVEQQTSEQAMLAAQTEFTRRLRDARTTEARVDALRPYLHLPDWDEVIIAALRDCGDEAGRALYLLTLDPQRQPSAHEDLFHRDLIFALQAVNAGIKLDQPGEAALVGELLPTLFATARDRRKPKFKVANKIIKALAELGDAALQSRIVAALIPYTRDNDRDVRRIAAFGLGWVRAQSEPAIDALLMMLREDEDKYNRGSAAQVLSDLTANPQVMEALRERLHSETDDGVMESLAWALGQARAENEVITELVARIHHEQGGFENKYLVYALYNALRASGASRPDLVDLLLDLLRNSKNGGMRYAAALTLAVVGDSSDRVIDALFYTLEHDNDNVVHAPAIDALLALHPDDHIITVRMIDLQIRVGSGWPLTERLAKLDLNAADIEQLLDVLESGDWDTKMNAADLLGEIPTKLTDADVERLIVALGVEDKDDWETVNAAGDVLKKLAERSTIWRTKLANRALTTPPLRFWIGRVAVTGLPVAPALITSQIETWMSELVSDDVSRRRVAASELLKLAELSDEVYDALIERLRSDKDEYLRDQVAKSLPKFAAAHPSIVAVLAEQTGEGVPLRVRVTSARGLGAIGNAVSAVIAALLHALEQEDEPNLRVAAAEGLIGLGQHQPAVESVLHQVASAEYKSFALGNAEDDAFKLLYNLVVGEDEDEDKDAAGGE